MKAHAHAPHRYRCHLLLRAARHAVPGILLLFPIAPAAFAHGGQIDVGGGSGGPVTLTNVQEESIGIQTAEADFHTIDTVLPASGTVTLDPDRRAHVTTRISGRIVELDASIGSKVEKGQKLAVVEARVAGNPPPLVEVTAPVGGTVNARPVSLGDAIEPTTELFDIVDLSQVVVIARVYEEDVGNVHVGQQARIGVLGYPGRTWSGTVTFVALELDPASRTVPVRIAVPNDDGLLRLDMYANVNLLLDHREGLLAVPREAILEDGGESFVFTRTGDTFDRVDVQTGASDDRFIEIVDGLVPGDQVVTAGQRELYTQWLTGGAAPAAADSD